MYKSSLSSPEEFPKVQLSNRITELAVSSSWEYLLSMSFFRFYPDVGNNDSRAGSKGNAFPTTEIYTLLGNRSSCNTLNNVRHVSVVRAGDRGAAGLRWVSGSAVTQPELHIQTACGPGMDVAAMSLCAVTKSSARPALFGRECQARRHLCRIGGKRNNYSMFRA